MVLNDENKILTKSLYLKGYKAEKLTDEFPEKSWTKHGANKLLKKLWDTGTVHRRPGSGRPQSEKKIAMPPYGYYFRYSVNAQIHSAYTVTRIEQSKSVHKCNLFGFFPNLLNICRKFEFLISQGSAATCIR